MKCLLRAAAALLPGCGLFLALTTTAFAADHRDSAGPIAFPAGDITDFYVFRSPADSSHLVLALNVYPRLPGSAAPASYFSDNVEYIIHLISCTATVTTLVPDINLTFLFSGSGTGQTFTLTGLLQTTVTGTVKQVATAASGRVQIYCGPRDDPFFFDLDAFKNFIAAPFVPTSGLRSDSDPNPALRPPVRNFFEGSDVSSIVVEFPIQNVTGCDRYSGRLRAWAETQNVTGALSKPSLFFPVR